MILPTPKPINFEVHRYPVSSTIYLTAYQKHMPIGIANIRFDKIGRSFHQSHTNCELNWNHAKTFPTTKNNDPIRIFIYILLIK